MKKKDWFALALGMGLIILLTGCPGELELSGENSIVTFSFEAEDNPSLSASVTGTIEITEITRKSTGILVTVPYGTDLTALVAAFTAAYGASVTVDGVVQESGVTANDFTDPVTYTVTAEDGSIRYYTVTVVFDPNTVKEITAFSFTMAANQQLDNTVTGVITGTEIALTVPYSTDVTELVATYTMNGASVTVGGADQISGTTANDFTDPVTYTVTAEDGTEQEYTVTVMIALNDAKEITVYSFPAVPNPELDAEVTGTITGTDISLTVPYGTDVTSLTAAFTATAESVTVGGVEQESGTTANDFTDPVTYTVTAEDSSVRDYTVTVKIGSVGDTVDIVLSPGGETFSMIYVQDQGSISFPIGTDNYWPATLTNRFLMGETEVNNAVMAAVLQWAYDNGKFSSTVGDPSGLDTSTVKHGGQELLDLLDNEAFEDPRIVYDGSGDFSVESGYENHPVTDVTWYGAVMFCNWLTEMRDGNTNNVVYTDFDTTWEDDETVENTNRNGYRLPSRDEWQYAARYLGTTEPFTGGMLDTERLFGDDDGDWTDGYYWTPGDYASGATANYFNESACREVAVYLGQDPSPTNEAQVKSLGPSSANTLGLYDMSGNVGEWCFSGSAGSNRVTKGGNWIDSGSSLQVGNIDYYLPDISNGEIGFRLCRTAD